MNLIHIETQDAHCRLCNIELRCSKKFCCYQLAALSLDFIYWTHKSVQEKTDLILVELRIFMGEAGCSQSHHGPKGAGARNVGQSNV